MFRVFLREGTAIVNGIVGIFFLIPFSASSLSVYIKVTDFGKFIVFPSTLMDLSVLRVFLWSL
jgi:hypothetical protein